MAAFTRLALKQEERRPSGPMAWIIKQLKGVQRILAGTLLVCGLRGYADAAVPDAITVKGVKLGMAYGTAVAALKSRGFFAETEMSIFGLEMDRALSTCQSALYEADQISGLLDASCEGVALYGVDAGGGRQVAAVSVTAGFAPQPSVADIQQALAERFPGLAQVDDLKVTGGTHRTILSAVLGGDPQRLSQSLDLSNHALLQALAAEGCRSSLRTVKVSLHRVERTAYGYELDLLDWDLMCRAKVRRREEAMQQFKLD